MYLLKDDIWNPNKIFISADPGSVFLQINIDSDTVLNITMSCSAAEDLSDRLGTYAALARKRG